MSPLLEMTLGQMLEQNVRERPDHEFVVYPHEGVRWTFREFYDLCRKTARGLMAMGIGKGDHVAIWATNVPQWLVTQFATSLIGAVLVTVNTNYRVYELGYLLKQSDTKLLVMTGGTKTSDYVEIVNRLLPSLKDAAPGAFEDPQFPHLRSFVFAGGEAPAGMVGFEEMTALADQVSETDYDRVNASLNCRDVINMQYTSGTTGFPKGVMLTHHNILNNGKAIGDCMKLTPEDRLCIPVPLFHCFGCVLGVMACLTHGTTMVMIDHFHPVRVMEALEGERCTGVHGVPTMFIAMLEHERFADFSFPALRTGIMAGSPCPIEVMRRVVSDMGAGEITIAFGQTELSPVITQTRTDDPLELRVTTVGRPLPHVQVKVIDYETGKEQPAGTPGEIVARGYVCMKGYYNMPEATRTTLDEQGWVHTGDIGVFDENGYLKITGRLKDMIIRGGENVYPREIEEFLYTHPQVRDVQVIGIPDERYGEAVLACVIPREPGAVTEQELLDYCRDRLSRFKIPWGVWFMEEFPVTASGKIQKFRLREMAVEKYDLQKAEAIETA